MLRRNSNAKFINQFNGPIKRHIVGKPRSPLTISVKNSHFTTSEGKHQARPSPLSIILAVVFFVFFKPSVNIIPREMNN